MKAYLSETQGPENVQVVTDFDYYSGGPWAHSFNGTAEACRSWCSKRGIEIVQGPQEFGSEE